MNRPLLKSHASLFAITLRASDPLLGLLVGMAAYWIYLDAFPPPEHYVLFLLASSISIAAVFPLFRLYEPQRGASIIDEFRKLTLAWATIGALCGLTLFATKSGQQFSRVWVASWLSGSFGAAIALRVAVRIILRSLRRRGRNLRHVAIVGAGNLGRQISERLRGAAWTGLNVIGYYDDDPAKSGAIIDGRPVLGTAEQLLADTRIAGIDQVWIALPLRAEIRIRAIIDGLRDFPVEIRFVPDIYSFHLLNHSMSEIAGLPVISLTETPMVGANRIVKSLEDFLFGLVALLIAAPALLVIAAGVRLSSPGPVFYRQERVTRNGQRFQMLKFRTMPIDAEAGGPVWSGRSGSRATSFGGFLRRFSLDELPQLINVIRGEMSLVGPRPERPEFVARFRQEVPGYMQKHLVKAGITGWAQINDLRGDTDIGRRIQYDLFYIDHWSLWFDLRILALTLWHILQSHNAR